MEQIFTFIVSFWILFTDQSCEIQVIYMNHFDYEVPEGIHTTYDWNKDGFMYLNDDFGNDLEMNYITDESIDSMIKWSTRFETVLAETDLSEGAYKIVVDKYTILLIPRGDDVLMMTLYNQGASYTHAVFEEKALKFARTVVLGEKDATHRSDCGNNSSWTWDMVWEGKR